MFRNNVYYIISVVLIIGLYLILAPKISLILFDRKNDTFLNKFIQTTVKEKQIDVQAFWKMREFYCPGAFTYDKTKNPFLIYSCKWLTSKEFLVESSTLQNLPKLNKKMVILQTNQILLYKDKNKLFINFVVSEEEMEKAVGVFDYRGKDKNLVKNKFWLDTTVIDL